MKTIDELNWDGNLFVEKGKPIPLVSHRQLKQSAIEDIKKLQEEIRKRKEWEGDIGEKRSMFYKKFIRWNGIIEYIKNKFNITEGDLK